jgi:hypothetical protein
MGSNWACKYLWVMNGVAVISLPVRGAWSKRLKEEKKKLDPK